MQFKSSTSFVTCSHSFQSALYPKRNSTNLFWGHRFTYKLLFFLKKNTFLPICVDSYRASHLDIIFECPVSSFPQPYISLPLSTTKLCTKDFQPIIAASDKYLASWKGHLSNNKGRTILVTSVLASASVYHMIRFYFSKGLLSPFSRNNVPSYGLVKTSAVGITAKSLGRMLHFLKRKVDWVFRTWPRRKQASIRSSFSSSTVHRLHPGLIG